MQIGYSSLSNKVTLFVPLFALFQTYPKLLLLQLAFQSLGVVFGDLGTSPLYVFYNIFPQEIEDTEQVIGALSLIIYSLTLIPLLKYVFIVLRANDNGQGKNWLTLLIPWNLALRQLKIKLFNVTFLVFLDDTIYHLQFH